MAPGCVPSSLQTNLLILAAKAKRERLLHTTPKEKKAVANEERIYNQYIGCFLPSLGLLAPPSLFRSKEPHCYEIILTSKSQRLRLDNEVEEGLRRSNERDQFN